ncbi:MAG: D-alanyl-D-alanine carboxypeptidase family protein [Bacilli bacterium]
MENLILVNKYNKLNSNFIPKNLIEIDDNIKSTIIESKMKVDKTAYKSFRLLQNEALKKGHKIYINSGYRGYQEQKEILIHFIEKTDYDKAIERVALPGHSEHQTGLAIDFAVLETIDEDGPHYVKGTDMFDDEASKWVFKNAHKFGFVLRFPEAKEEITHQSKEPWHLRYVGSKDATIMYNLNMCLEEYLDFRHIPFNKGKGNIPIIGIVGRPQMSDKKYPIIGIGEYYRKALSKNNACVITINPPQNVIYNEFSPKELLRMTPKEKEILETSLNMVDGIILPGGNRWYEYDEFVANYALENNIPILGICLGMQTLGYVDNLKIATPKYKTYINETDIDHHQIGPEYVHAVNLKKGSRLYEILKQDTIMVNSRHSYNIGEITNEFKVYGFSNDGIPEYFENGKKAYGFQWHPELMQEYDLNNQLIFKDFVDLCRKG